jgi:hypothetical protein
LPVCHGGKWLLSITLMRIGMWLIEQLNAPRWNPTLARTVVDRLARMLQYRERFFGNNRNENEMVFLVLTLEDSHHG